jgi:hypothetical protein
VTRTTGVLNSLMINVAVLRGVGMVVRVGTGVKVGTCDAVGLVVAVNVLAGVGLGRRSIIEQACRSNADHRRMESLRIETS